MIVVTGGTGLVGGHLLYRLSQKNTSIRAIFREGTNPKKVFSIWKHYTANPQKIFNKIKWVAVNTKDLESLRQAFDGAHEVYHCAAKVSFDSRYKKELWDSNVKLTEHIVNICLEEEIDKLVYVSSVAAIGESTSGEAKKESDGWQLRPKSIYAKTKTKAELEVWRGIAEGLQAVILNPTVILGPGNWKQSSIRIFDLLYHGIPFYPNGATGFVDVEDVINAMLLLMEKNISGERYILNSANLSYQEIFTLIAHYLKKSPPGKALPSWVLSISWLLEGIRSRITGQEARVTRQSAHAAKSKQSYSALKFIRAFNYTFRDIKETIQSTSEIMLKEKAMK